MSRLVAFGCSFTYGEGLPDCLNDKKGNSSPTPSKLVWPALVGEMLSREVVNLGCSGSSNKHASISCLETDYQEDDIVIFLWTYWHRTAILRSDGGVTKIIPSNNEDFKFATRSRIELIKNYYGNIYNPYDSFVEDMAYINLAKRHLDSKGIKNWHFHIGDIPYVESIPRGFLKTHNLKIDLPEWNQVTFKNLRLPKLDTCPDGHPGPLSQQTMAGKIYKGIKKEL